MTKENRITPNPNSSILARCEIAGVGLSIDAKSEVPEGFGAIVLYVPMQYILGKNIVELQQDIGLPWNVIGSEPVWLDEHME